MAFVGEVADGTSASTVDLEAPGQGRRWYITDVTTKSNQICRFSIESPLGSERFGIQLLRREGFEKHWGERGLPMPEDTAVAIRVSAGVYDINHRAVVR